MSRHAPLTDEQRARVDAVHERTGIPKDTLRRRVRLGWPDGRLHEQPISDPKRAAQTRRYTPACRPKKSHPWFAATHPKKEYKP